MKNWIVSILFTLCFTGAYCQASLGFTNFQTPGLADTVILNSTVTYGVTPANTGTQPFVGTFTVYVAVEDTSGFFLNYVDSANINIGSLQPGDSTQVTFTHTIDPTKFVDGGNTVVIWPASPGTQTTDTIFRNIFVMQFEAIAEEDSSPLKIYPNPAVDFIMIQSGETIESVRILTLDGKQVIFSDQPLIAVQHLSEQIYLIEVKTISGNLMIKKLVLKK